MSRCLLLTCCIYVGELCVLLGKCLNEKAQDQCLGSRHCQLREKHGIVTNTIRRYPMKVCLIISAEQHDRLATGIMKNWYQNISIERCTNLYNVCSCLQQTSPPKTLDDRNP